MGNELTSSFRSFVTVRLVLPPFTNMVVLVFSKIFGSRPSKNLFPLCVFAFLKELQKT